MNAEQLGLVILSAAEVPNFLAGLLPSIFTIRTFADDPEKVAALRRGEIVGGGMALGVGIGASLVAKTWAPAVACLGTLAVLLYEYERAIRNPISQQLDMRAGAMSNGAAGRRASSRGSRFAPVRDRGKDCGCGN